MKNKLKYFQSRIKKNKKSRLEIEIENTIKSVNDIHII